MEKQFNHTPWLIFLSILFILNLISIYAPQMVVVGIFLFLVPGYILMASTSLFLYGVLAYLILWTFNGGGFKTFFITISAIAIPALWFPYHINEYLLKSQIDEITSTDKNISEPIELNSSIAFITTNPTGNNGCAELCRNLLINNAVETVGVAAIPSFEIEKTDLYSAAFYKLKSQKCVYETPPAELQSCFESNFENLEKANHIVVSENFKGMFPKDFTARNSQRYSIYEFIDNTPSLIFRVSEVQYKKAIYPFIYGTWIGSGTSFPTRREFFGLENIFNRFEYSDLVKPQRLFGKKALTQNEISKVNDKEFLLENLSKGSGDKTELQQKFRKYFAGIALDRWTKPSSEETSIVLQALSDQRIDDFEFLGSYIKINNNASQPIMRALLNRMAQEQDNEILIDELSKALLKADFKSINYIGEEIQHIAEDRNLRDKLWGVISSLPRVNSELHAGLPIYQEILDEATNPEKIAQAPSPMLVNAVLVGICKNNSPSHMKHISANLEKLASMEHIAYDNTLMVRALRSTFPKDKATEEIERIYRNNPKKADYIRIIQSDNRACDMPQHNINIESTSIPKLYPTNAYGSDQLPQ